MWKRFWDAVVCGVRFFRTVRIVWWNNPIGLTTSASRLFMGGTSHIKVGTHVGTVFAPSLKIGEPENSPFLSFTEIERTDTWFWTVFSHVHCIGTYFGAREGANAPERVDKVLEDGRNIIGLPCSELLCPVNINV